MDKMEKKMTNPATVIGAATQVKGNLEGDEDLLVVGRVDGNINLTKTLTVDPKGVVVADVQVREAIISGQLVGNVTATDLVHITEQGRVVGDLTAPRVVLVDGAAFRGAIDMGDMEAPATARPLGPRARPSRSQPEEAAHAPAPTSKPKPVPKPAPPPRRVVPQSKPKQPEKKPDTLDKRAEAAAKAVASQAKKPKPKKKKAPKPPTTAGRRTRARRK